MALTVDGMNPFNAENPYGHRPALLAFASALVLVAVVLAACREEGTIAPTTPTPEPEDVTTGPEGGERVVELAVVEGERGAVLAFAPMFINGEGPFLFALDTGASNSLIDQQLAEELGLEVTGEVQEIRGVIGAEAADLVAVSDWSVGDVGLPEIEMVTVDLGPDSGPHTIQGLLGSDMLSIFGAITVDYEEELLILRSRQDDDPDGNGAADSE